MEKVTLLKIVFALVLISIRRNDKLEISMHSVL